MRKIMSHRNKKAPWEKYPVKKPSAEKSETKNGNCKRFTGETLVKNSHKPVIQFRSYCKTYIFDVFFLS